MKKFDITVSLGIIILLAGLMIMLGLLSRYSFVPSYRFLAGRNPTACREDKWGGVDKCYTYSFEADFNSICSNAEAELIGAGFIDRTLPGNESRERRYWLKGSFLHGPVDIKIFNNTQYIEDPISKGGGLGPEDGWVVVTVAFWQGFR